MRYLVLFSFLFQFFLTHTIALISSRTSSYSNNSETRVSLEPINGTLNFRMHGKRIKDDKWTWDGREGRYIYCVRPLLRKEEFKCEKLQSKSCFGQNIPYEMTSMELTNFYSQDETLEKLHIYKALSHVPKCWSVIQPFICAVLLPKCENINGIDMVYLPSLEMCKITMEPCKILYNTSLFPDFLKCNETSFPSKCNNDVREMKFNLTGQCLYPLVPVIDPYNSYNEIEGCGLECKDPFYTDDEHRQIRKLIGWCTTISLFLHLFAILTFTIDWHNGNKYPALIIFYINICYLISCIGWLAQFIPGGRTDIVCRFDNTLKQGEPSGGENLSCILVFILIYYFLMAAICWFVIFTYAWHMSFKAIGKIQERIEKKASYFHLIAWSIPLVMTITILAISEVDANSIVGICFVGYVNHPIRFAFVVGPVICSLLVGGFFLIRGIVILVNIKISSKQIISSRASKKIRQSIVRMGICSLLMFSFIIITITCHIYEFKNSEKWWTSLTRSIICIISTSYTEDDSSACRILHRPSISLLQLHLISLFASGIVMASFVFTPSSLEIWARYFRKKFGQKVDEPLKLQKHKVIAQAFAKRKVFQNQGRLSISFHNSHTDPVGLKFDVNSAVGSHDFSSTWANNLPRFVNRRYALTGCPSSSRSSYGNGRRNSIDSEISFSVRHVSVESRRNSNDSQVSVKIAEMKTKVASRSRGSKSKSRSSKHQRRADFTSKRCSRKESSTSLESQIFALTHKGHSSTTTTAEIGGGMIVPLNHKRRSGVADLSPEQINELIARNRILLPYLTTSEEDKSTAGSLNIQSSKIDEILKQIGLSEHKIIENKQHGDQNEENFNELVDEKEEKMTSLENVILSCKDNLLNTGKFINKSGGNKKGFKTNNARSRKHRKSTKSLTRNANSFNFTNFSTGKVKGERKVREMSKLQDGSLNLMTMEMIPFNENILDSVSGRSDVGVHTEIAAHSISSMEFAENLLKQDRDRDDTQQNEENDATEHIKLLPKELSCKTAPSRYRRSTNEISLTESEKLKLLLLPSK